MKIAFNGVFADAAAFNKKVKLVWPGIGTAEAQGIGAGVKSFRTALEQAGITTVYSESPARLMYG
ncbi:MAG: hypothetical protein LAQ30_00715 [Acidobacteriia bacterium]|nr:hypothetical protein [Terriglobia bacterium]